MSPVRIWEAGPKKCPDSVGAYHEALSRLRPGFDSRSGRRKDAVGEKVFLYFFST